MKKKIELGKVDFNGTGRKINAVTVEIELKDLDYGKKEFSACCVVWNANRTDIIEGGQFFDTISEYVKGNALFDEIYGLWKMYHLNGMQAGTHRQEDVVSRHFKESGERYDYDKACDILSKCGLLYDKLADNEFYSGVVQGDREHYRYGSAWLVWDIPEKDLKRIEKLFDANEEEKVA